MSSKFLDICTTNSNEVVKYYNMLLLLFSVVILSKTKDTTIRIIFSLIYLLVILQYTIPVYLNLGQEYSSVDKSETSIGMFFITGISIVLSLILIYGLPTTVVDSAGYTVIDKFPYSLLGWNIVLFFLPSIPAIFYTQKVKLDFTGVIKKD